MAYIMQLINRESGTTETFSAIDEKLCEALGVPCDPERYYQAWYDVLGWDTCGGASIADIAVKLRKQGYPEDAPVLEWLALYYVVNVWIDR